MELESSLLPTPRAYPLSVTAQRADSNAYVSQQFGFPNVQRAPASLQLASHKRVSPEAGLISP
jgi:hypothetical protein